MREVGLTVRDVGAGLGAGVGVGAGVCAGVGVGKGWEKADKWGVGVAVGLRTYSERGRTYSERHWNRIGSISGSGIGKGTKQTWSGCRVGVGVAIGLRT